ncbi:hypothetical protein ACOSQ4_008865 [Xanthoceras sorbifolium]
MCERQVKKIELQTSRSCRASDSDGLRENGSGRNLANPAPAAAFGYRRREELHRFGHRRREERQEDTVTVEERICRENEQQLKDFAELALKRVCESAEDRTTMTDAAKQLRQLLVPILRSLPLNLYENRLKIEQQ